jgi:hypothetical protein
MGLGKLTYVFSLGLSSLGACSQEIAETSETKIVNGQAVSAEQFPSVIKLLVKPKSGFFANDEQICTGVIINSETVVAAAHCIKKASTANPGQAQYQGIEAALSVQGFNGKKTATALSGWAFPETIGSDTILEEQIGIDLTVIKFEPNTFVLPRYPALPAPASTSLAGSEVTLVGYGATGRDLKSGAGNKNTGKNKIAAIASDRGYLTVAGSLSKGEAVAGKGDSGGPVFASDGTNPDGILLGIGSAYVVNGDLATNYFVDLSSPQSQALLKYSRNEMADTDFTKVPRYTSTNAGRFEAMCSGGNSGGDSPFSNLLPGGKNASNLNVKSGG